VSGRSAPGKALRTIVTSEQVPHFTITKFY
jgi:hypothetical protein